MPARADLDQVVMAKAKEKGIPSLHNQYGFDMLQPGGVMVVDLYGKKEGGAIVGDDLLYHITKSQAAMSRQDAERGPCAGRDSETNEVIPDRKHASGIALRTALEERIKRVSREEGIDVHSSARPEFPGTVV